MIRQKLQARKEKWEVGIVIPLFQKKYIAGTMKWIRLNTDLSTVKLCLVNDGKDELRKYLDEQFGGHKGIEIVHLKSHGGFARANNAGWCHLIERYPSIRYIGSLNDDTAGKSGWLLNLLEEIQKPNRTAIVMPVMQQRRRIVWQEQIATWKLYGADSMRPDRPQIEQNTFVSALNGFCFIAKRSALEQVGFFDEAFMNGCEDIDLGVRLLINGWRMLVVKDTTIFHFAGKSRFKRNSGTNLEHNHRYLQSKYPEGVEVFNRLDTDGFLVTTGSSKYFT